ncbi:MAG: phytoene desaturase family protein [Cellulosilyticaceae bacterium]
MKKVAIIGSGIGGLCTGIRLLSAGFEVVIYEKNSYSGGVVHSISPPNTDLLFDYSASLSLIPMDYWDIFKDVNLNPKDYIDFIKLPIIYKVFFKGNQSFTLTNPLFDCKDAFENTFPDSYQDYMDFVKSIYKNYTITDQYFLNQSFIHLKTILNPKNILALLRLNPIDTAYERLCFYMKDNALREFLLFQTLYMGSSPFKLSSVYTTIPAVCQGLGLIHIKGGMGAYTKALTGVFTHLGGEIYYNTPIQKIIFNQKTACGVLAHNTFIGADIIVNNTDFSYAMTNFIPGNLLPSRYLPTSLSKLEMTCSVFILYLGLDQKFDTLSVHNVYIPPNFRTEIERIFNGYLPSTPPLYIYYPSAVDDTFNKNGHTCMNIMLRVPNLHATKYAWRIEVITALRNLCVNSLSNLLNTKDLEHHIIYESCTTPHHFKDVYHYTHGASFGLSHKRLQSIIFRPQCRINSLKNLYFVGSSIHPGNGLSIVMKGAKITAQEIIHHNTP